MIRHLIALLALAGPACADTARVLSGEHDTFTRLVVELPDDSGWSVGRTAMGYGFAAVGAAQPDYDLTAVWDRIPRTRLQSLRVDPATGALLLSLACPCHVFPFEYQPGMIVLDIRDGPPPPGSSFEMAFAPPGSAAPRPAGRPERAAVAYDWIAADLKTPAPSLALDLPTTAAVANLDPLRDALLRQISRGAADGVIDMQLPGKVSMPEAAAELPDQARVTLGELPGLVVRGAGAETASADACLPDSALSVADWGKARRPLDLLAEARSGLFGEFDILDQEAVLRAVRVHVYLGFGAEARQYGALLSPPPGELLPLLSMARLIDGETDPSTPFAGMLACDGAAALWAALAYDRLPAGSRANTDAIVRSFVALPAHLRSLLGPRLAEVLREDHPDAARMVRDALERTPDVPTETIALLDAETDLVSGDPTAALTHAADAVASGGATTESLLALVEAHFRSGTPLDPKVVDAVQSLAGEVRGTDAEPAVQRAVVLALALSGQVDKAFARVSPTGQDLADLWKVVAERGEDNEVLARAILPDGDTPPEVGPDTAERLAVRLMDMGFPDAARDWLGPSGLDDPEPRRLIAARIELARGDARQALTLLQSLEGEEAARLRAQAQMDLGALDQAQETLSDIGETDEATRLAVWQADWADVEAGGDSRWAPAAGLAATSTVTEGGPLTRGALLDGSAATREAISTLLSDIAQP